MSDEDAVKLFQKLTAPERDYVHTMVERMEWAATGDRDQFTCLAGMVVAMRSAQRADIAPVDLLEWFASVLSITCSPPMETVGLKNN